MGYLRLFAIPSGLDDFSIQTALVFMRISTQNNEEPEKEIQKQGRMNEDFKSVSESFVVEVRNLRVRSVKKGLKLNS
jgi:hypothetical protein